MSWIAIALASAIVGSGTSIADKMLLQNYVRSHVTLQLFIGIAETALGLVFVAASARSGEVTIAATVLVFLSGAVFGFGGLFLIYVLKSQ